MLTIGGTKSTPLQRASNRPVLLSLGDEYHESVYQESDRWCNGGKKRENGNDYYELGVCNTYYPANKDANPNWPPGAFTRMFSPQAGESYSYLLVKEIVRAYALAAESGKIPEYVNPHHEVVIAWMRKTYPQWPEDTIRVVMLWLSQGVKNGVISPMLLQPKTYAARATGEAHPAVQSFYNNYNNRRDERDEEEDWTGKLGSVAKTVGIVIAIGVGAYALVNVTKLVQTFKPATA